MDVSETQLFKFVHDVYPLIDPKPYFESQTFKVHVVIITGGSKGIGATTALFYVKAGARPVLVARNIEDLEERKVAIEKDVSGVEIMAVSGDISDPEVSKRAVQAAAEKWNRVDIVVSNCDLGSGGLEKFHEKNLVDWWYTQEVNVRGTLNIVHAAIPELLKTKGQVVVTSSQMAHLRMPIASDYCISKHTVNRFVEILALEYPELGGIYAVHPGVVLTPGSADVAERMGVPEDAIKMPDTVELPAATFLWLTARNAEFLSGRYMYRRFGTSTK